MTYDFNRIEKKWQQKWKDDQTFAIENPKHDKDFEKPKFYVLEMFPYPSGAGLHVGHPLGYIAGDIYARFKRHEGYRVLHPQGFDAFGLPAEQYAIQTGQHPAVTTKNNIAQYKKQLNKMGFAFDWQREVKTSDPNYYRWTQWIFLQLFHSYYDHDADQAKPISDLIKEFEKNGNQDLNAACDDDALSFSADQWNQADQSFKQEQLLKYRLTYLADSEVNWCPELKTVLANDEVVNGVSERGGHPVVKKKMKQWIMRISAYADRLLTDSEKLDWSESIKETQRNWIGKSKGASLSFEVAPKNDQPVYMTGGNNAHLLIEKAKENRNNPTEAEAVLWQYLRSKKLGGHKFRQQHIIDDYIVDFVCLKKGLVVEVDGKYHEETEAYDKERTLALEEKGFEVIRFKNEEVIGNIESVLKKIEQKLKDKTSLSFGEGQRERIEVFSTRPDTIYGVSFIVLSPEHQLVDKITTKDQQEAVKNYQKAAAQKSERERMADVKTVTGAFTGAYALHPLSGKKLPIWIADYVLAGYGTGAVMAVPCGDQRDHDFAKQFDIEIPNIFKDIDITDQAHADKENTFITRSDFLNDLPVEQAIEKAIEVLEEKNIGKGTTNYRIRDAVFSRQRYWGEPIPIYFKNGYPVAIDEKHLPLELPEVEKYLPTEDGEPPLGRARIWAWNTADKKVVSNKKIDHEVVFPLELNTMPGWAGSSWYPFRYMEKDKRDEVFASSEMLDYWENVDLYIGGSEHATGHLLYARFWIKFLKDIQQIQVDEPFKKMINQGMILGESAFVYRKPNDNVFVSADAADIDTYQPIHADVSFVNTSNELDIDAFKKWRKEFANAEFILNDVGKFIVKREVEKMSKSKYNVVNPDDICEEYGADSLRLYEMFLGPLEQSKPWNTAGISGVHSFLKKTWRLYHSHPNQAEIFYVSDEKPSKESLKTLHKTIKKVREDLEEFSFNTSVSSFMICVNELQKQNCHSREILEPLAVLLSPFVPHIAEELWEKLGYSNSIVDAKFPVYQEKFLQDDTKTYPVAFNGKKRFTLDLSLDLDKQAIEEFVMNHDSTKDQLGGKSPKKVIVVPGKIINIVV
jgi:leucyl-tRNA synthetase